MSYIKQEGGTRSFRLTRLTIRLLKFCNHKRIVLIPVHLPGRNNIQADRLSRPGQTLPTEWEIHPDLLQPVFGRWGRPWIDLFATFANKKCPKFVSPFPDPRGAFIDALSIPWRRMGMAYAFPPFKVIPSVLAKIRQSVALTVILIAPYRMDASWMPELLHLSRDKPSPVHDDQKPPTQVVHRTDGTAENRTYVCSNLHTWKL